MHHYNSKRMRNACRRRSSLIGFNSQHHRQHQSKGMKTSNKRTDELEAQVKRVCGSLADDDDFKDPMKEWVMQLNSNQKDIQQSSKSASSGPGIDHDQRTSKRRSNRVDRKVDEEFERRLEEESLKEFDEGNRILRKVLIFQQNQQPNEKEEELRVLEEAALRHFDSAIDKKRRRQVCPPSSPLTPRDSRLFVNRCILLERMGLLDKAKRDAEKAVSLSPNDVKSLYRLARMTSLTVAKGGHPGQWMEADGLYRKCFSLSYDQSVWKEMVSRRLEFLMKEASFTLEEVGQSHVVSESLQDALLYCQAVRSESMTTEAGTNLDGQQLRLRTLRRPTNHFIVLDLDEQVAKVNGSLTPENVFSVKSVVLYECLEKDPNVIRSVMSEFGVVRDVSVSPTHVKVTFKDVSSPSLAISRLHGQSRTFNNNSNKLLVRFSAPSRMSRQERVEVCQNRFGLCYGWRTTGCPNITTDCPWKHRDADYKVDFHPFMNHEQNM